MSTPPSSTEGLLLPAERARRGGFYLGLILAAMLCLVLLEALVVFVTCVLILGEGIEFMGSVGVGLYAGLPVLGGVVSLLLLIAIASRYPALRIDSMGISNVWPRRTKTVRWADIDKVQFNSRRSYLLLVLKAGALPEQPNAIGGPRAVVVYSLGNSLWRRRRPTHADLIIGAVERFGPGRYTVEPLSLGKGGATGAGASA
ncbi:PH domain-containing protein [Streptomyces sp. NPDC002785]|uniref:PH domain-containing protein n=1 Tax=Streptomyces sp. NPDC002785 TaxID=3154543 RepID=UPI003320A156